jgi:predicted dehydrogenase
MSEDDVSLLLIGGGRLAEVGYIPALAEVSGIELAVVVEPDPTRRDQIARAALGAGLGTVSSASTLDEALDARDLDMAVVASPVGTHLAHASILSGLDIPTLVEKPPAPDAASTAQLAALDPAPWIGFNRRFDPGAAAVRDVVAGVGDGFELRLKVHYLRRSWRAVAAQDDALLDLGPHLVDWALWMTGGNVESVRCSVQTQERAHVELTLDRGRVLIEAATDQPWREVVELRRRDGTVMARHSLGGPVAAITERVRRRPRPSPLVAGLSRQLVALARAATGRTTDPRLATAREGLAVMAVLDAARKSGADGGRPLTPTEI